MPDRLEQYATHFYWLAGLMLLPALLIDLGNANLFVGVDEATRALVALEMLLSDNFITPTLNGDLYYNKPPLYNWILAAFFWLSGSTHPFVMRLPNVLALLFFGWAVYHFNKPYFDRKSALLLGFMLVTAARVLYWESMSAYIDIALSAVVYVNFMSIYRYWTRGQLQRLFVVSYLLTAVAFMLKGLPALVFQGITLSVLFIWKRQFWKLFSIQHVLGFLAFLLPVGSYYLAYSQYNSLEQVWLSLWNESAFRTLIYAGWEDALAKFLVKPLEMLYPYAPWSVFVLLLIQRGFWKTVRANDYLFYWTLVFFFNGLVYWTAPRIYPKYILMLVPLAYTVGFYFYQKKQNSAWKAAVEILLLVVAAGITLLALAFPFLPETKHFPHVWEKSLGVFAVLAVLLYLFIRLKSERLILLVLILLVFRLPFSWFVWPQRAAAVEPYKQDAGRIVEITQGAPLYYLDFYTWQYGTSWYITKGRQEILRKATGTPGNDTFYIATRAILDRHRACTVYYEFPETVTGEGLFLVKFRDNDMQE